MSGPKAIDLFCGSGGMSAGFKKAGYNIILAIDKNKAAINTYKRNNPNTKIICNDIRNIKDKAVNHKADIIIGGFPCKPFSSSNRTNRNNHPDVNLYLEFLRFIELLSPKLFVMENVPSLVKSTVQKSSTTILNNILNTTKKLGYKVQYQVVNMLYYGLPQKRERIFIVGTRTKEFMFPVPTHKTIDEFVTVKDAISDLPEKVRFNSKSIHHPFEYNTSPSSLYQKNRRKNSKKIWNHFSTKNKMKTKKRFKYIPQGGNWRDIPLQLLPGTNRNRHNNLYRRLQFDGYAPTITHVRKTLLIHPLYDRLLSAREAARLQGFDDNYYFDGNKDDIYQQIADSIPPIFAECLAKKILEYL